MKKQILFLCVLITGLLGGGIRVWALEPGDLQSGTAVLMDADTGQVLFDKGMNERVYPASTTKIMTGILAVENAYPGEVITASAEALRLGEPDSSTISLSAGEELTVGSALYALMLPSANDAANVLAEYIGGDLATFANMMTDKAHMLGAVNTNFANAHGLHDDNHYTTAYDMALITRYAMGDPRFMQYFGAPAYTMPATNRYSGQRQFINYQYMLLENNPHYYPDVTGGKVGYTTLARNTMSTTASRGGRNLIAVVMLSPTRDSKFTDTKKLLDFGFDEFVPVTVGRDEVEAFEIPITDGGEPIGAARFQGGAPANFLIHQSVNPADITVRVEAKESYERGEKISAALMYYIPSAGEAVPQLMGSVPLAVTTETYDVVTASLQIGGTAKNQGVISWSVSTVLIGLGMILTGSLLILLIVQISAARRRRRARMRRLQSRMRAPAGRMR